MYFWVICFCAFKIRRCFVFMWLKYEGEFFCAFKIRKLERRFLFFFFIFVFITSIYWFTTFFPKTSQIITKTQTTPNQVENTARILPMTMKTQRKIFKDIACRYFTNNYLTLWQHDNGEILKILVLINLSHGNIKAFRYFLGISTGNFQMSKSNIKPC